MAEVTIRGATAEDAGRIAEIMYSEPGREAVALVGDLDRARRFGSGLVELDKIPNPAKPTVVAQTPGRVVGVLQYTRDEKALRISLGHVRLALGVLGPIGAVRRVPQLRARARVDMPVPANSFYIAELHVAPDCRGDGIGGALLDWAAEEAHRLGAARMTLTTTITNPARRLYERQGFTVIRTATDRRYEGYTGIPGRVLMERRLE